VKLVVDASVAVKWLVEEERHDVARDVLREGFVLLGPDLLLIEVSNALRNKVRARLIGVDQARAGLTDLPQYFDRFFTPVETLVEAFELACRINHPVADCVYVACAMRSDAVLLTDDAGLHQKTKMVGADFKSILLTAWTPGLPVPPAG